MTVTLNWPGGEHEFALPLGQLRALQERVNCGPEALLQRMGRGEWFVDDLIEVLRCGLIGGGMPAKEAGPLVTRIAEAHPKLQLKPPAVAILMEVLVGVEDDPVGEQEGATTPQENGNSASYTDSEPSSD